mmetsp:Transcript_9187/g.28171  ORF Transcript_9187/g.28171 Transcript_9187/m.28171 type:complete len:288 (+) Transcript_9187:171-1034(+)
MAQEGEICVACLYNDRRSCPSSVEKRRTLLREDYEMRRQRRLGGGVVGDVGGGGCWEDVGVAAAVDFEGADGAADDDAVAGAAAAGVGLEVALEGGEGVAGAGVGVDGEDAAAAGEDEDGFSADALAEGGAELEALGRGVVVVDEFAGDAEQVREEGVAGVARRERRFELCDRHAVVLPQSSSRLAAALLDDDRRRGFPLDHDAAGPADLVQDRARATRLRLLGRLFLGPVRPRRPGHRRPKWHAGVVQHERPLSSASSRLSSSRRRRSGRGVVFAFGLGHRRFRGR